LVKKNITKEKKPSVHKTIKSKAKKEKSEVVKPEIISKKQEDDIKTEYLSSVDQDLDIPAVPEAPKKKEKLTLDTSKLSGDVLERIKKIESPDNKVVLVNCERCGAVIPVPVPKKAVLESELPVVPISYVHKNLHKEDQHCLTIHLDHDFDIRRQRLSDVVISSD
jgi:hypothetical protein